MVEPQEMQIDVFVSHSAADKALAEFLIKALERHGWSTWSASGNIHPGDDFSSTVKDALAGARIFLVLLTPNTNFGEANLSMEWSMLQGHIWSRSDSKVCSVRIANAPMPPFLTSWQALQVKDLPAEIDQVLNVVEKLMGSGAQLKKGGGGSRRKAATRFSNISKQLNKYMSENEDAEK